MAANAPFTDLPAHRQLHKLCDSVKQASIEHLLLQDPARAQDFTLRAAGLELDYARQLLDRETRSLLWQLAAQADITAQRERLFNADPVNNTECRPALHTLLRATTPNQTGDRYAQVTAARQRMGAICTRLANGDYPGFSGATMTDVVNIGIGGSDLGPRLVSTALQPETSQQRVRCHYVANVDPADLLGTVAGLAPATTLFILCSKSFHTEETLCNAEAARQWLLRAGAREDDLNKHFLAITANTDAAVSFGLSPDHCLPVWDWVGGRYSVWSSMGLSCAVAIGVDNFHTLLSGAAEMDTHFRDSPIADNMPVMMALLELWNCNYLGAGNHVVLPYCHRLQLLPDFLQQLTMESNGKRVNRRGEALHYDTAPILWGAAGTMGQHSFHQLLHQGTRLCPADFILPLRTDTENEQYSRLVANCLAQSRAMVIGRTAAAAKNSLRQRGLDEAEAERLAPHLAMPGNRPHNIITMNQLTPHNLGALLALYEHRTFCSAQLWGINPFDQWGVELGKQIGEEILATMNGDLGGDMDAATQRQLQNWRAAQTQPTDER